MTDPTLNADAEKTLGIPYQSEAFSPPRLLVQKAEK